MRLDSVIPVFLLVVAVVAAACWHFREPLREVVARVLEQPATVGQLATGQLSLSADRRDTAEAASSREQTVYRWVDEQGVTHFDQAGGAGRQAVVLDPDKVQSMDLTPPGAEAEKTASRQR